MPPPLMTWRPPAVLDTRRTTGTGWPERGETRIPNPPPLPPGPMPTPSSDPIVRTVVEPVAVVVTTAPAAADDDRVTGAKAAELPPPYAGA